MTPAVIVAIVSTTIAACSLGYAIWDKVRSKPRRRITVQTLFNSSLLRRNNQATNIEVRYNGNVIKDPHVATLELVNTGNTELKKTDMSYEPVIDVGDSEILSYDIGLLTRGSDAQAKLTPVKVTESKIELGPIALNPGDRIVCELFVDGGSKKDPTIMMQASGFIIDRERPTSLIDQADRLQKLSALIAAIAVIATVIAGITSALLAGHR